MLVAVEVGVTLREADTVTVREIDGVVVTVMVRAIEPDTEAVVDPDRLLTGDSDAGSDTIGVLVPPGDEVRTTVDDTDAVEDGDDDPFTDNVRVLEIRAEPELSLVAVMLAEIRADAVPVVEPETLTDETRERVTEAVVDPDRDPLTDTVPVGDVENDFVDVETGDDEITAEELTLTVAEFAIVREPDLDVEGVAPTVKVGPLETVIAAVFEPDMLVVDDGDAEANTERDGVDDAIGAAEHDGRGGTDVSGSVEHSIIRIALLFASLTSRAPSAARTRTPVGALNVAAVLTPSRKGVDTPTRPASVSTDLSE